MNWKGVAYYNRLINYLLKKGKFSHKIKNPFATLEYNLSPKFIFFVGITPYANLYHYDLPLALEKRYKGLLSYRVV